MQKTQQNEVLGKLRKIENLLEKKKLKPLNTVEASRYLSISLSHLYKLSSQRKIPFHKPNGKCLYFFEDELDEWITAKTNNEPRGLQIKNTSIDLINSKEK